MGKVGPAPGPPLTFTSPPFAAGCLGGGVFQRQINGERRPGPRLAFDLNEPAMVVDHAVNNGKPEAGPFAAFFRAEKWFENVGLHLARHADPGIADANAGI